MYKTGMLVHSRLRVRAMEEACQDRWQRLKGGVSPFADSSISILETGRCR